MEPDPNVNRNTAEADIATAPLPSSSPVRRGFDTPKEVTLASRIEYYIRTAKNFLHEFRLRLGKPMDTIFKVGVERYHQGEVADAATRFRMVLRFQPDNVDAWFLLGSCAVMQGNTDEAATAFQEVLRRNPAHEEARFLLATVAPQLLPVDQKPRYSPLRLVVEHFDIAAYDFDEEQLRNMGYRGHEVMYQSILPFLNPQYPSLRIADLGCGSGLIGQQFRNVAARIEGVDVSANMLGLATERRDAFGRVVYDDLILGDLRQFLLEQPAPHFDIITAGNVFHCVGGLTPVFDGVLHCLKPGGVFAFSVEPMEGTDFDLVSGTGRFAHSDAYIRDQAKRVGLDVLEVIPFEIYRGEEGMQYVLRRPAPQTAAYTPPPAPEGTSAV